MLGRKIKELRINNKMTQKELAEKLYVSAQAVSRWENGEVEPSLSTLVEIAKIFNVSTDELLNVTISKDEIEMEVIDDKEVEKVLEKEVVHVETPKIPLTLCTSCNSPLYEKTDIIRINEKGSSRVVCKSCNEKELIKKKELAAAKEKEKIAQGKSKRVKSFIYGGLAGIVFLIISISSLTKGNFSNFLVGLLVSYAIFSFVSTLILNNTFINEMFFDICGWGIVKFPGLIWEFSIDGFMWLIAMKLLFAVIGFILGVLFCILAAILCGLLSIIVYPFALRKNFVKPEYQAF